MKLSNQLHLLVVDDNQLYTEQLIEVLEANYYSKVTLGFLDDKAELLKLLLRQSWDVLVMGKAYDLTLPKVMQIIKEQEIDLPVIGIIPESGFVKGQTDLTDTEQAQLDIVPEGDSTDKILPLFLYWGAVDALPKDRLLEMATRITQEHTQLLSRRELAKLKQVLRDAEQRANILIKNSKSAVAYLEDGLHIYANDPYLQMFGFKSMDDLMGFPVVDLIASNNIKDFKQFLKDFEKGNRSNVEFKFESVKTDGSTFAAKLQLAAATYEGQPCQQVIIQPNEQGNSAELAKKLAQMERIDPLTKLYNRKGFEEMLVAMREQVVQKNLSAGALSVRIDDIGKINSSLGIQGVDTTVVTLAEILKQKLVELLGEGNVKDGFLSRFNDSNFMIIIPNIDQPTLVEWSEKLIAEIADTLIEVGQRTVKTTITIGATMLNNSSPEANIVLDRILQAVNLALKESNNEGNKFYLYDPSAFANSDDAALLEALRTALEQGKFSLYYQPIYDVEKDVSNMFEVYLRLPLADGTLMSPDKFSHIADQHNLMDKIDRWMLIRACKDLKRYRTEVDASARIIIHLSPRSLMDETLPSLAVQLTKAIGGDMNGTLTLQFNEVMMNDYLAQATKQVGQLQQIGCHVGIYNFGGAVNAMELLDYIKPNLVRLDRSYVKDLGNSDNLATITSLIQQVNEHGTSCLMPFIEDPATMSAAWTVGARYLQGDYLQAPSETMHIEAPTG